MFFYDNRFGSKVYMIHIYKYTLLNHKTYEIIDII